MGEAKSLLVQGKAEQTEMGVRVSFHSKAVNITVELDLDEDPEFFYALAEKLPEMVVQQMNQIATQEWVGDDAAAD